MHSVQILFFTKSTNLFLPLIALKLAQEFFVHHKFIIKFLGLSVALLNSLNDLNLLIHLLNHSIQILYCLLILFHLLSQLQNHLVLLLHLLSMVLFEMLHSLFQFSYLSHILTQLRPLFHVRLGQMTILSSQLHHFLSNLLIFVHQLVIFIDNLRQIF